MSNQASNEVGPRGPWTKVLGLVILALAALAAYVIVTGGDDDDAQAEELRGIEARGVDSAGFAPDGVESEGSADAADRADEEPEPIVRASPFGMRASPLDGGRRIDPSIPPSRRPIPPRQLPLVTRLGPTSPETYLSRVEAMQRTLEERIVVARAELVRARQSRDRSRVGHIENQIGRLIEQRPVLAARIEELRAEIAAAPADPATEPPAETEPAEAAPIE